MEKKKDRVHLTNEVLRDRFKNSFDLVNYAIKLAENMIRTGREARVKSDVQNRAMLILEEIYEGKDQLDQVADSAAGAAGSDFETLPKVVIYEEVAERKKPQMAEIFDDE